MAHACVAHERRPCLRVSQAVTVVPTLLPLPLTLVLWYIPNTRLRNLHVRSRLLYRLLMHSLASGKPSRSLRFHYRGCEVRRIESLPRAKHAQRCASFVRNARMRHAAVPTVATVAAVIISHPRIYTEGTLLYLWV